MCVFSLCFNCHLWQQLLIFNVLHFPHYCPISNDSLYSAKIICRHLVALFIYNAGTYVSVVVITHCSESRS